MIFEVTPSELIAGVLVVNGAGYVVARALGRAHRRLWGEGTPTRLPQNNLWDSVRLTDVDKLPEARHAADALPVRRWCRHLERRPYLRTDTRCGPGWMSDTYEGVVCARCRKIISETKTY